MPNLSNTRADVAAALFDNSLLGTGNIISKLVRSLSLKQDIFVTETSLSAHSPQSKSLAGEIGFSYGEIVPCPLPSALRNLLTGVLEIGTADTKQLAKYLHLSKHTINSQFKDINNLLGTHGREEAIIHALHEGWVMLPIYKRVIERINERLRENTLNLGVSGNLPVSYTLVMKLEDRDDFVDLVAQAVIDRIEERDRIDGLVNMVVSRVIEMQRQEAAARAAQAQQSAENSTPDNATPDHVTAPEEV